MDFLTRVNKLSDQMLILAKEGEHAANDDSCLILYGMVKDNAYLIKKQINYITKDIRQKEAK